MSKLIGLLLFGALHAQSITEVPTSPDALAGSLDRSTTIEIRVPVDATAYAFSFGPDRIPLAMASMLHEPAGTDDRLLQVLIVPPDQPGGNGICDDGGLAGIFITQTRNGMVTSPNYMPFCTPYPQRPGPDAVAIAIDGEPAAPGQWQPILLYTWNARGSATDELDYELMFSVHVSFTDTNTTAIPQAQRLRAGEILEFPAVREQLGGHD